MNNYLIAIGLIFFLICFIFYKLNNIQEQLDYNTELGFLNYYYNIIALEQQGFTIDDDGWVKNASGIKIEPIEHFGNVTKLNKDSLKKILKNLNL